jgi:5-methylcytosine-specific restriction protein A
VDYEECDCGRGHYDPEEYRTCYTCYLERRESYVACVFCGRWHSPKYNTCFQCRSGSPERDEAGRNLRLDILMRDDFICQNCGARDNYPQVDHIEPCAKGGTADLWNLQVLCRGCNQGKGADYDWRWEQRRFRLMHLYFTYGWRLLDDDQRARLVDHASADHREFMWHARYRRHQLLLDPEPPDWGIAMADTFQPEPERVAS